MSDLMERLQKKKPTRKSEKFKLRVDEILYKEARNSVQALIKDKKENFCKKSYLKILENQKSFGKL